MQFLQRYKKVMAKAPDMVRSSSNHIPLKDIVLPRELGSTTRATGVARQHPVSHEEL